MKMHYLLSYEFVEDMTERRVPFRAEHLALARTAFERAELVVAGAFSDAPPGAIMIFRADQSDVVDRFVAADPYVQSGLVTRWQVRPLQVGFGG
jgi:uncharacterized protein YciI